jgi:quinohemoprotein ethanol dehydrogenase
MFFAVTGGFEMKLKLIVSSLLAVGVMSPYPLAFGAAKDLTSATTPADRDFPKVGGNLGNQNYSSLTQINKSNVKALGAVWRTNISQAPTTTPIPAPGDNNTGQQTSALVIDGVIYIDTPVGGVAAIDGKTGAVKWKWTPSTAANGFNPSGTRRGVSVGDGKVYTLSGGNRVVALDKDTGAMVWAVQPTGPGGVALGNIAKVGTVYWDGMVYIGTNDGNRGAGFAVRSSDGTIVWSFFGTPGPGTPPFTDVNGVTTDAAATWQSDCALRSGGTPWIHPSLDPELGMVYYSFGNLRGCNSSQDGSLRAGDNLFGNSIVAIDAKTGAYKWHFQSIRHDVWDMDNVAPTVLGDIQIGGETKKAVYYGSKSSLTFILDRTNGKPLTPVVEVPVPTDSRQVQPVTQKFPAIGNWQTKCIVYEKLGTDNIPGSPWRAVPNYNGYQPDANGNLVYTSPNYLDVDLPFLTVPAGYGSAHRRGCLYDTQWDFPVLATTTQNGGNDFSGQAFVQHRNMYVVPYGYANVAHYRSAGQNGLRAPGEYQGGGILAMNAATGEVLWDKTYVGLDMAHGQTTLATASDLVFAGRNDGYFTALDVMTGEELWRFQTGAAIEGGSATYSIDDEQYVVALSFDGGDIVTAFKLGGQVGEMPHPTPPVVRRNGGGTPTPGSTTNNTVYLARGNLTADTSNNRDSIATNGMVPNNLGVAVGTTVTFRNPGAETFPLFPNLKEHCATQFFEGLFNAKVQPGQSFQYTFDREGEYWYNDCTDPRPTGRINVLAEVVDLPGALTIEPKSLNFRSPIGASAGSQKVITAVLTLPDGYTLDTGYGAKVTVKAPLSNVLFDAVSVSTSADGKSLTATFNQSDIDNNMDAGAAVPLTVSGLFMNGGVQKRLTATANVRVIK